MHKKKILFIGGSLNQTSMMYEISKHLPDYDNHFTPHYADGILNWAAKKGWLDFTVLGGKHKYLSETFLNEHNCKIDCRGTDNYYDLVITSSDLIVQENIRNKKVILVQEGMTDPENLMYYLVKKLKLPRFLASTSTTGLSNAYNLFCVASEGYRELFIKKGVTASKIRVTGIPNFDNVKKYLNNKFPYKNYVLVATSDSRETLKYENRKKFIERAKQIAEGRKLVFKLHPNENHDRAIKEINRYAPDSLIFINKDINELIANCDILLTKYSSVVYVGLALGKNVYSDFDLEDLKALTPIQNDGTSAQRIAAQAEGLFYRRMENFDSLTEGFRIKKPVERNVVSEV